MDVCAWVRVYMGVEWMCVQVCFGECAGMLGCVCRGASANVQGCLSVFVYDVLPLIFLLKTKTLYQGLVRIG